MKRIILATALFVIALASGTLAQTAETLKTTGPNKFTLTKDGSKEFVLNLKKGDYVELSWVGNFQAGYWGVISLRSPEGQELIDSEVAAAIAPADGAYRVIATLKGSEDAKPGVAQALGLNYTNVLRMPAGTMRESRKINGYDVKIIVPKNTEEGGVSTLLIEKAGKPQAIVRAESYGMMGFNFADKGAEADDASAKLFAATADKTGDGNPDVAVEYYSGGAHCCFSMYFFELGKDVVKVPVVSTGDAPISALARNPKGGLYLATADNLFAYWNIHFAGSPFGDLVLEFRGGRFRPSPQKMVKPAPSMEELEKKAAEAKALMNDVPYKGSSFAGLGDDDRYVFEDAFWSTMIDLIYTGNKNLAWKYLDMVWPANKQGKDIFRKEFQEQLENGQFWEDIRDLDAEKR